MSCDTGNSLCFYLYLKCLYVYTNMRCTCMQIFPYTKHKPQNYAMPFCRGNKNTKEKKTQFAFNIVVVVVVYYFIKWPRTFKTQFLRFVHFQHVQSCVY